jgi:glycerol-3-phosphate acyltransferase PlsY
MIDFTYLLLSYLIGSIPFGLILSHIAGLGDIRKIGSGNIGATNVLRSGNKFIAFLTLILDGAKGAIMVLIGQKMLHLSSDIIYIAAALAVIGHIFPVFLKFKGGKGVATSIAVVIALTPFLGILICIIWLTIFSITKISSISSIIALMTLPIFSLFAYMDIKMTILYLFLLFIMLGKHYENIRRLINGEEKKINLNKGA